MPFSKYKKEYKKFRNNFFKTYFILEDLIYDIKNNSTLEKKKVILHILNSIKKKQIKLIENIDSFDFTNIKEKVKKEKCINNLIVLPLYNDDNIYINPNKNIGDIFQNNTRKDV